MEQVQWGNETHLQKPQHRNHLGVILMIVKPKMTDDCINRWGGIFWSNTWEFLKQTNNYNQAMGCTVRGFNPGGGKRFFSPLKCPDWLWGKPNLLFNWYRGSFPSVKQSGYEVKHSPSSRADVKNK